MSDLLKAITVREVALIMRMAKLVLDPEWLAKKSAADCWMYVRMTSRSFARLAQYGLEADVVLTKRIVGSKLKVIYDVCRARHAELAGVVEAEEAERELDPALS